MTGSPGSPRQRRHRRISPEVIRLFETEPEPLRQVELAAIWFAEAQRELDRAIVRASEAGESNMAIGRAMRRTDSAVSQRLRRLRRIAVTAVEPE